MALPQPQDDEMILPTVPTLTMSLEFSIELPVEHGLRSGYVEQFLGCAWTMRRYRKFTQFSATAKSGGHIILTTVTDEETTSVRAFLQAYSTLQECK